MKPSSWVVIVAVFAVVVAVGASSAAADSAPFTQGDAQALFNAGNTGGLEVSQHAGVIEGAPAPSGKRIGPGQNFQGFHVCTTDWHVMFISLIATDATDGVHNVGEARGLFATIRVTYELDGAPLATQVTPVMPWLGDPTTLDPNATVAFSQRSGAILAPDALSVGAHTERVRVFVGGVLFDDLGDVTFYVDAAGIGACI